MPEQHTMQNNSSKSHPEQSILYKLKISFAHFFMCVKTSYLRCAEDNILTILHNIEAVESKLNEILGGYLHFLVLAETNCMLYADTGMLRNVFFDGDGHGDGDGDDDGDGDGDGDHVIVICSQCGDTVALV